MLTISWRRNEVKKPIGLHCPADVEPLGLCQLSQVEVSFGFVPIADAGSIAVAFARDGRLPSQIVHELPAEVEPFDDLDQQAT